MLATKDMMLRVKDTFSKVSENFKEHLGGDEKVMVYLGMNTDIVNPLLITDAQTIISICLTGTTLNTFFYPNSITGHPKLIDSYHTSMILTSIIRKLEALDVKDIVCRFYHSNKFTLSFTFNHKKRKLIYYNNKDFMYFFPDSIFKLVKDKTLILACWGCPQLHKCFPIFHKYVQLMSLAKKTFYTTSAGYYEEDPHDDMIEDCYFGDEYKFKKLTKGYFDYHYRFEAVVECAIHSNYPRDLDKFIGYAGTDDGEYYLYSVTKN